MIEKHARLCRCYPHLTFEACMFDLTSAQGWAWYNWAVENEMTFAGPMAVRVGLGYVGQEREAKLNS